MNMERAKRMVLDLRAAESKLKGTHYDTFAIRVDDMARDAADMIVALAEEVEKTRERLRVVALEDLAKINYLNLQLETERNEMKYLKKQLSDREEIIKHQSQTLHSSSHVK